MSDVSALSHEYRTSAKLAGELNSAIIAIKKGRLHRRAELSEEQRCQLTKTLDAVRSRMANEEKKHKEKVEYLYSNTAFPQTDGG